MKGYVIFVATQSSLFYFHGQRLKADGQAS